MTPDVVHGALFALATYLVIGSVVAVPFVIFDIGRIDPAAKAAPWTFRALVLPGVVAMWPLLVRRFTQSRKAR
jgi:hypothetical protein